MSTDLKLWRRDLADEYDRDDPRSEKRQDL